MQKLTAGHVSTTDQQNSLPDLHRHLVGATATQPHSADDISSPPQSSVGNDPHDPPLVSPAAANSPEATEPEQLDVVSYARQLPAYLVIQISQYTALRRQEIRHISACLTGYPQLAS